MLIKILKTKTSKDFGKNSEHTVAPILLRIRAKTMERLSFPSVDQTSTNATHSAKTLDSGIRPIKLSGESNHALLCGLTKAGERGESELNSIRAKSN